MVERGGQACAWWEALAASPRGLVKGEPVKGVRVGAWPSGPVKVV